MGQRESRLEDLVIDAGFWRGRRVFLTGHTGFKGAWTALLLRSVGAEVYGLSLPPQNENDLFNVARLRDDLVHRLGDIRDIATMRGALEAAQPDVVIHMAAQALVRASYDDPVETYTTNILGTVNLLEAARWFPSIKAVVVVTSDKCYENNGSLRACREDDPMGGHDPYSSSKGCAEIITASYRRSFFQNEASTLIASGGDWSRDRLVPDIMQAFMAGEAVRIRNPDAIRPWQHVMDPVMGYLMLAQRLVQGGSSFAEAWNFGPGEDKEIPVSTLVQGLAAHWGTDADWVLDQSDNPHEAAYLKLNCEKARTRLDWLPVIDFDLALKLSSQWYRAFHQGADMRAVTLQQINTILAA
jgi:CDP-glucose 4,6-dehydratase